MKKWISSEDFLDRSFRGVYTFYVSVTDLSFQECYEEIWEFAKAENSREQKYNECCHGCSTVHIRNDKVGWPRHESDDDG